jgi:hypothetical protein
MHYVSLRVRLECPPRYEDARVHTLLAAQRPMLPIIQRTLYHSKLEVLEQSSIGFVSFDFKTKQLFLSPAAVGTNTMRLGLLTYSVNGPTFNRYLTAVLPIQFMSSYDIIYVFLYRTDGCQISVVKII